MVVESQVIRFTKDSSGTTNATQDVNLNFTPKAIRLFSDGGTTDATVSAEYQYIEGFSDGTNQACVSCGSVDAAGASVTGRIQHDNSVFVRLSQTVPNTTTASRATCVFATNKVTFTWAVNDAVATRITMWAIGGDDITSVKVSTVDTGRNTAGTQNYTGLGFNPADSTSVLFLITSGLSVSNTNSSGCHFNSGVGATASKRWVFATMSEHGADPSDTWRYQSNQQIVHAWTGTGTAEAIADFNGWVTDGFQLDWTDPPTNSTQKLSYIVINGGNWDAGMLSAPASSNNVDTTVSVNSNTIRGLMLESLGLGSASNDTITTFNTRGAGVADYNGNMASVNTVDEDAQTTMDSYRYNSATTIMRVLTTNGADALVITFDSFPSTSAFRLDFNISTSTVQVGWVVVADAPIAPAEVFSHSYGKIHSHFDNNTGPAIFG